MKRSNLVLLLMFVVLGVAVLILIKPFSEPVKEKPPELGLLFPGFNRDTAAKLEFASLGGSTVIEKDGDSWFVIDNGNKFPADPAALDDVFDTIESLVATELISTNSKKHITFQVNAPQNTTAQGDSAEPQTFKLGTLGTEVIIYSDSGDRLVDLYVGKNGASDFMTTYVRKADSVNVLLADGFLKAKFGKGAPSNWKDRTLLKAEKDEFARFIIGEGDNQVNIEVYDSSNDDGTSVRSWRMVKPSEMEIESKHSDRLINMFSRFLAVDYAEKLDDPSAYGFETPVGKITVELTDGASYTFTVGAKSKERETNYYIKKSGDNNIYLIPEYRANIFNLKEKDFLPSDSPPNA